jgi:riboflavin-specific deaminase-like protein
VNLFAADPDPALAASWESLLAQARNNQAAHNGAEATGDLKTFAELYRPFALPALAPYVVGQLGQSLDGYIAAASGASHYVTGPESLVHLHRLRALADAVVVGWRTVAADDPQLTVRNVAGPSPLRVVIDLEGRLPGDRRMFAATPPGALRLTRAGVPPLDGVESIAIAAPEGRYDPRDIVTLLAQRGCRRILVEGGGATISSFLAGGALDRLHLAIAPLITGEGIRGLTLPSVRSLSDALRPLSRTIVMGRDVLFDLDLQGRR